MPNNPIEDWKEKKISEFCERYGPAGMITVDDDNFMDFVHELLAQQASEHQQKLFEAEKECKKAEREKVLSTIGSVVEAYHHENEAIERAVAHEIYELILKGKEMQS